MIDHLFDIRFEPYHYFFAGLIAIFSFLLSNFYFIYPQYDKILHFFVPIIAGSFVFHTMRKLKISFKVKLMFTFCIVVSFIGLAEIGEYLLDVFFDLKLQGVFLRSAGGLEKFDILVSGLDDTMIDMVIGTIGVGIYVLWKRLFGKNH
ncbi:MAG: hypothetical protein Q8P57_04695 [Candidatus Pacearchaeota archaeon]|nr:hypothetical protein [Candidatus Pacearchaeota archaeon]